MGLGNCTCHVKVELAEALSFCFRDARYPQHLMRSARRPLDDTRVPGVGSGGGLEHTGQHFAGGEQATAMPPDMLDGGVATVRVELTDGVLDQVNTVAVQDQAAGRAIDADFCDHAAKNDLAVAQQFQERICVGSLSQANAWALVKVFVLPFPNFVLNHPVKEVMLKPTDSKFDIGPLPPGRYLLGAYVVSKIGTPERYTFGDWGWRSKRAKRLIT